MKRFIIILILIGFIVVGGLYSYHEKSLEVKNTVKEITKVVIEDEIVEDIDKIIIENKEIYMDIELAKKYFDEDIRLSEDRKKAYISLENKDFNLEEESITKMVKDKDLEINIPTKLENNREYIPIKLLSKLFNINVEILEESQVVVIDRYSDKSSFGRVKNNNAKVKTSKGFTSFTIDKLSLNEEVRVFSEEDEWYRVRTSKGYIGYIKKADIEYFEKEISVDNRINKIRENNSHDDNINITWEYVYEKTPDIEDEEKIEGLDVVSPTWFSVEEDGRVINKAHKKYVNDAHNKGYKVWGLIDNGFDPESTSKIINNEELKDKVIAQIIFYASLYDLDGINIDFENVYYKDQAALVDFVRTLTKGLKKQNLMVSMDVTVPGGSKNWSLVYDREELAKIVDYMALMAYDEHWATSPKSGSVASIGWVERGIVRSLETIPKEKLLLGVPFYTRIWKETTDENGNIKVSSKAIPIKNMKKILEENNAQIVWDEETGQNYGTYKDGDTVYKVWIEDSKSLELKVKLAHKYGLKGIASWRKGYEYREIWEVIKNIDNDKKLL